MTRPTTFETRRRALSASVVEAGGIAFTAEAALAERAGIHASQITRVAGGQEIGGEAGWRLAGLASVVTALLSVYEPAAISGWLHGTNPHLYDRRPLDVLAEGDVAAVMRAVQSARAGVFA